MSFFEEAVSKVKKAADTVGKNAGMVIDSGKLKVMEAELKGEVKKRYGHWASWFMKQNPPARMLALRLKKQLQLSQS